jgi:hypothetical protein
MVSLAFEVMAGVSFRRSPANFSGFRLGSNQPAEFRSRSGRNQQCFSRFGRDS